MSYFDDLFINNINKNDINIIFELGSRDLNDSIKLYQYYGCKVYAFECNPDCLLECKKNLEKFDNITKNNIFLIENAISIKNDNVIFYPFDLSKYNNMGASSMLKIDFSKRDINDPDYNKTNVQKEIIVKGIRLDTFMYNNKINKVDMLCIDLQGYELNAIKSLGDNLSNIKYIITECSINSTYENGTNFIDLYNYLKKYNFQYVSSNKFEYNFPNINLKFFSEFDALFVNILL